MTAALEFQQDLRRALRGEVRFDPYTRLLYSTDASAYQMEPLGVALPRDAEDVQAALTVAARHGVPVLARGNGTSLAGQAVGAALILDVSRHLNRILDINPEAATARVEPGVVLDALTAALKPHGLMFGPDPASSNRATLGGMVSNNSTGAHSVLYGMTADHVLEASVLLDDATALHLAPCPAAALPAKQAAPTREGALYRRVTELVTGHADVIRERFPRTWRRASGYSVNYLLPDPYTALRPAGWYSPDPYPPPSDFNLAKLMVSSEGTLAVLTDLTLRLVPRPRLTGLCVAHFDTVAHAAEATPAILECAPAAVEMIDAVMINLTRSIPAYARQLNFIQGTPGAILIVEFFGDTEAHLLAQIEGLETHLRRGGWAQHFVRALTPAQQADVWGVRKVGLGLLTSMRGDAKPLAFMEDVAVPVDRLGEYVRSVQAIFQAHGVDSAYYAHASAGCLHIRPVISLKQAAGIALMKTIGAEVLEVVLGMGGAYSGEHGDGLSRSGWNGRLFGPELYAMFREIKRAFDPQGRMNPGKIIDPPDMTQNLRYGADYGTRPVSTHLSFEREGGFAAAVEQCSGIGECRKEGGVMCPSFKATREEEHSTRGRANALRAALSGRLPVEALTAERMHAVLDLCLECKACQAECPAGVDMAKIKYEFLAQYQAEHGVPLRSRVFAQIHALSRLGSAVAPLANPLLAWPATRWLNAKALGLAPQRTLPPFASPTFRQWYAGHPTPAGKPPVILFVDTFTNFNHPDIGQAAVRLLEAAGYAVQVVDHGCCGRPMISKGLLTEARAAAQRNIDLLAPWAAQGIPIVGLEPSCVMSFRDEYRDLLPDQAPVRVAADQVLMFEEFLTGLAGRGELRLRWESRPRTVWVHGHCYQKALTGTKPLVEMLRLPGWTVQEIDAGCCGMAGSFGYEAEHYALSQAIGEERLFPAVRQAPPEVLLVAAGMSCRHQVQHGTGRQFVHPVVALAEALA